MSFRVYPRYLKGNPQLRVFLPNFWMKLAKPKTPCPENQVHFIVPLEMSDMDVRNYLEKIYKLPVIEVRTEIVSGDLKKTHKNYLIKDDDYRMAYVTMTPEIRFKFPDLFPAEKMKQAEEDHQKLLKESQAKDMTTKKKKKEFGRADVPSWFGI